MSVKPGQTQADKGSPYEWLKVDNRVGPMMAMVPAHRLGVLAASPPRTYVRRGLCSGSSTACMTSSTIAASSRVQSP